MSLDTEVKTNRQPTRKHIAERQRRARINHLLEQIEFLISPPDNIENPVRLEKAEVLERTVEYIKRIKVHADYASSYVYGYMKCIESIDQYLQDKQIPQTLQCDVHSYLVSLIRGRNKLPTKLEVHDQSIECMDRSSKNFNDEFSTDQSNFHVMYETNSAPYSNIYHKTDTNGCVWRPWCENEVILKQSIHRMASGAEMNMNK